MTQSDLLSHPTKDAIREAVLDHVGITLQAGKQPAASELLNCMTSAPMGQN